jgi:hypothetical protein
LTGNTEYNSIASIEFVLLCGGEKKVTAMSEQKTNRPIFGTTGNTENK